MLTPEYRECRKRREKKGGENPAPTRNSSTKVLEKQAIVGEKDCERTKKCFCLVRPRSTKKGERGSLPPKEGEEMLASTWHPEIRSFVEARRKKKKGGEGCKKGKGGGEEEWDLIKSPSYRRCATSGKGGQKKKPLVATPRATRKRRKKSQEGKGCSRRGYDYFSTFKFPSATRVGGERGIGGGKKKEVIIIDHLSQHPQTYYYYNIYIPQ